jgi:hypothetical protein
VPLRVAVVGPVAEHEGGELVGRGESHGLTLSGEGSRSLRRERVRTAHR